MSYSPITTLPAERLVDTIEVVAANPGPGQLLAPANEVVFGASGNGFRQHRFDGRGRYDYLVEADVLLVESSFDLEVVLNGPVNSRDVVRMQVTLGGFGSNTVANEWSTLPPAGTGPPYTSRLFFRMRGEDGVNRSYLGPTQGTHADDGASFAFNTAFGTIELPADPLSTLTLSPTGLGTDGLGAGTLFSLYELERRLP